MTPVQTLGQSLDHWQALYIVAIAVAFASTAAIVTFAFHIQEHKSALKASNYLYVVASLLAVVSTVVIINKTKSLDSEKDREVAKANTVANLRISDANKQASDAYLRAGVAGQQAASAQLQANILQLQVATLTKSNTEAQRKLAVVSENSKPRILTEDQKKAIVADLKTAVAKLPPADRVPVTLKITSIQYEALRFMGQVVEVLKESGLEVNVIRPNDRISEGSGILFSSDNGFPPLAIAITYAFQKANCPLFILRGAMENERIEKGEWFMFIGDKYTQPIWP